MQEMSIYVYVYLKSHNVKGRLI